MNQSNRYHVDPETGKTGQCNAEFNCPFGGDPVHGATPQDARMLYEQYIANDIDPETNQFSTHSKKEKLSGQKKELSERTSKLSSAWNKFKENVPDVLINRAPQIAIATGLISAIAIGGGLVNHSNNKPVDPHEGRVESSKVITWIAPVKVGKVTTYQTQHRTEVKVSVDGEGKPVQVNVAGSHNPKEGSNMTVYRVGEGKYQNNSPHSLDEYAGDTLGGVLGGSLAGCAALAGSFTLGEYLEKKNLRKQRALRYA